MPPHIRIVTLEGNIGAGKSTVLRQVEAAATAAGTAAGTARSHRVIVLQEPVHRWCEPALPDGSSVFKQYCMKPKSTGLAFQMYVLLTRVQQLHEALRTASTFSDTDAVTILTERCYWSDYEIFGRPMASDFGYLSEADWYTYTQWYKACTVPSGPIGLCSGDIRPTGLVYLRSPIDTCQGRIAIRNRSGEDGIAREYLNKLHETHEQYVAFARDPASGYERVLDIDGASEGDVAVRAAAERVIAFCEALHEKDGRTD